MFQAAAGSKSIFGLFGSKPAAKPKPMEAREVSVSVPTYPGVTGGVVREESHGKGGCYFMMYTDVS